MTSELPNTSTVDIDDEPEVHRSFEICIEGRFDGSRNPNPIPSSQASSISSTNTNQPKRLQLIDHDTHGAIPRACEQGVQDCGHETLQDMLKDNMYFRKKLGELSKHQESLEQQVRVLQSQLRVRSGELGSQPVDPLEILCDRIVDLKHRLNARKEFLDPYLKPETENHHRSSMLKRIEPSIYNMSRILESVSAREEFRYPKPDHLKQESNEDLGELLGNFFVDVQELAPLAHLRSQVCPGDLVQAIVGAAVCEWVFESEFRCSAMMKTPLLEAFRDHMRIFRKCAAHPHMTLANLT